MSTHGRWTTLGLAGVLALSISVSTLAAQRGGGPRGGAPAPAETPNRGNNGGGARGDGSAAQNRAQARQQIQANRKAAIDRAQSMFQLAMLSAKSDGASSDPSARAHAQAEIKQAQIARKSAIDQANRDAKSAQAALQNSR